MYGHILYGTTIKDSNGSMYTEYRVSAYTDTTCTEDRGSACADGSVCTEDFVSVCTDVYDDNRVMRGSMCPYIYTNGTGMHVVASTDEYKVNTFVHGRTDTYDKCGR